MPSGVLNYALGLNAASFLGPLSAARGAIGGFLGISASVGGVAAAAFGRIKDGARLRDLANQTGETVGSLFKLERAFAIVGGSGQNLGQLVGAMQRSLGGVNEAGEPTAEVFKQIGLNIDELRKLDAPAAIGAITGKLAGLDKAGAAAAAGKIFGRGLSGDILKAARDSEDFAGAMKNAATAAEQMQRNAGAFDRIDDSIANLKAKIDDLLTGIAAKGAGAFTNLGAAFEKDQLGQLLYLELSVGFEKATNAFSRGLQAVFAALPDLLEAAGTSAKAKYGDLASKLTGVGAVAADAYGADGARDALAGVSADTSANAREAFKQVPAKLQAALKAAFSAETVDILDSGLTAARDELREKLKNAFPKEKPAGALAGSPLAAVKKEEAAKSTASTAFRAGDVDALTRIGAIFGGRSDATVEHARATSFNTRQTVELLKELVILYKRAPLDDPFFHNA